MGRSPCCAKEGLNRGAWTALEDKLLKDYITIHGEGRWRNLPLRSGLKRCGKSCRLRWLNYLRPDIKRGNISHDEEELIIRLHKLLGNRWSLIAGRLPGRTDNEIKNYWNTNIAKKLGGESAMDISSTHHKQHSSKQLPNKEKKSVRSAAPTQQARINSSTCVVWTKASKCSKVFLNPDAVQQTHFDNHDNNNSNEVEIMVRVGEEFGKDKEETKDNGMILSFSSPSRYYENLSDFGMDVGELCLSEFLNFPDLYDQNQTQNNKNDNDESSDRVKLQTNATTTSTTSFRLLASFLDSI